jgi:hypothetical protein
MNVSCVLQLIANGILPSNVHITEYDARGESGYDLRCADDFHYLLADIASTSPGCKIFVFISDETRGGRDMNNCHLFERLCQGLHPNAEIIVASKPFVPFDTLAGWNSDMRAMRMNISSASSNKYPGKSIIVSEATIKVQEAIDKNASLLLKEWKSNEVPVAIKSAMAGAESLMCGLESRLAEFRGSLKKVCNDRKITLDQGVDILARKAKQLFGPKLTANVDTSNIVQIIEKH